MNTGFFGVFNDELGDAMDQCMGDSFVYRKLPPGQAGFFFGDRDGVTTGVDIPELLFEFDITGTAEINLGIARGGVGGGISATIFLDWHDYVNRYISASFRRRCRWPIRMRLARRRLQYVVLQCCDAPSVFGANHVEYINAAV